MTGRVDPGQEERGSQLNAGLADYRSRVSLIADRGFRRSQNAGFRDRAHVCRIQRSDGCDSRIWNTKL